MNMHEKSFYPTYAKIGTKNKVVLQLHNQNPFISGAWFYYWVFINRRIYVEERYVNIMVN